MALVHEAEVDGRLETVYAIVDVQGLRLLCDDQLAYMSKFLRKLGRTSNFL